MYKELKTRITNTLKAEFNYIKRAEDDEILKIEKFNDILHMQQIISNFDELEPVIADYLNKKARKEKFER